MANSKATCGHQKEVDAIPATAFYQDVPSKDQSRLLWNLFSLPLSHNTSQLLSPTTKQYFPVSTDQQTLQRYPHAPLPYSPPQSANKVSEHQYALLPPVFTILSLAVSRTLAALPLPEGYYVTNYIPIPEDERDKLGLGNPQAPFFNATFECFRGHYPLWQTISIWGFDFPGVTEKMVRKAVHGAVTQWKFTS
jgi:hypothetical protein